MRNKNFILCLFDSVGLKKIFFDRMVKNCESSMQDHQKLYSLRKCKRIFKDAIARYKHFIKSKKDSFLSQYEKLLDELNLALEKKDPVLATRLARELEGHFKGDAKKGIFVHARELVIGLILAISVAAFVRQMWFELYEIPTGSMRPTFREQDRVLVTKNAFGINTPFQTSHLKFDPKLVQRGSIIVFTGDKMDIPDVDTTYFMLFPGKKRYVKRCVGKPGDTLYFYGGEIYGVDKNGNEIRDYIENPELSKIEHIPFITFEGKSSYNRKNGYDEYVIKQMDLPLGKITVRPGAVTSEVFDGKEWQQKDLSFSRFWGMNNFALARIITKEELPQEARQLGYTNNDAKYYIELKHSPSMASSNDLLKARHSAPLVSSEISWIALSDENLKSIKDALYTSRFYVQNGSAFIYAEQKGRVKENVYLDSKIPDGLYDFFSGTAYEIGALGPVACSPDHPIYPKSKELLKVLFNSGIEISNLTNPSKKSSLFAERQTSMFPTRFAYFRNGVLFVMGKPIFTKDDKNLTQFEECEINRKKNNPRYRPFLDTLAPMKDGHVDKEFIKQFGLKIPDKMYLGLGDNHAMSLDCRYFGFIPEENIQGTTELIFWPLLDRAGIPEQPNVPFLRIENLYVYTIFILICIIGCFYSSRRNQYKRYLKLKTKK